MPPTTPDPDAPAAAVVAAARAGTRAPSIADVAARAGVSMQTVSRVVNGADRVAPATRTRVEEAIAALGYRRNVAARALATGRSDTVGILAPSSTLYGPASITAALGLAATAAGMNLSLVHALELDPVSVRQGFETLAAQQVSGIVVVAPVRRSLAALSLTKPSLPVVAVDGGGEDVTFVDVSVDNRAGARTATEHLLAAGHRTVWHVAGPENWNDAVARRAGWEDALRAAGAELPPVLTGDWSADSGYEAGRMLARIPTATAVFTANDAQALGLLHAMADAGRGVPEEVSVVGFDDTPETRHFLPPLTTLRQPFDEVGRRALQVLLEEIASHRRGGSSPNRSLRLAPELLRRDSVAAPQS